METTGGGSNEQRDALHRAEYEVRIGSKESVEDIGTLLRRRLAAEMYRAERERTEAARTEEPSRAAEPSRADER